MISFSFEFDWLRKWREFFFFFKPSSEANQHNHRLVSTVTLKIALDALVHLSNNQIIEIIL